MINMPRVVAPMFLVLVAACSREQTGSATVLGGAESNLREEQAHIRVVTPRTMPSQARGADTSTPALMADMRSVSGLFCRVKERLELLAMRDEALREEERLLEARRRQDVQEDRRLQTLFEQYSNCWEQITDEHDRFMVARMIPDLARAESIMMALIESGDNVVVADVAAYLRFFYERRLNRPDEALTILIKGEERVLAGREWTAALKQMNIRERNAVCGLYHKLALAYFARANIKGVIDGFTRAAECAGDDPQICSSRYVHLARAYENIRDRYNALVAYSQAEQQLMRIADRQQRALLLECWDDIQRSKRRVERGIFENSAWRQ
jgi:tetratricopeptide (TPR) repeat protein